MEAEALLEEGNIPADGNDGVDVAVVAEEVVRGDGPLDDGDDYDGKELVEAVCPALQGQSMVESAVFWGDDRGHLDEQILEAEDEAADDGDCVRMRPSMEVAFLCFYRVDDDYDYVGHRMTNPQIFVYSV